MPNQLIFFTYSCPILDFLYGQLSTLYMVAFALFFICRLLHVTRYIISVKWYDIAESTWINVWKDRKCFEAHQHKYVLKNIVHRIWATQVEMTHSVHQTLNYSGENIKKYHEKNNWQLSGKTHDSIMTLFFLCNQSIDFKFQFLSIDSIATGRHLEVQKECSNKN